jgi:hypothetical protein
VELNDRQPIFIGFKMDSTLRRTLLSLSGSDRKYISDSDPSFLMICRFGKQEYIGKVIEEGLTTDRIDDIRRNVLSILQRICPDMRFPQIMEVLACDREQETARAPTLDAEMES